MGKGTQSIKTQMEKLFEFGQGIKEHFAPTDPKELVRKWQAQLRTEQRVLDRQIRDINFEEKKVRKSIKDAAKRGDMASARSLAKEVVASKKAVSRIHVNKAQLMSINNALIEQLAMLRVAKTMGKSTEVMKMVMESMNMPELRQTMMEMSREMAKAGLIDEMMNDALDSALDTEDMEDEVEAEVNKVLDEVVGETLASLPAAQRAKAQKEAAAPEQEEDEELDELHARLQAVKAQ